MAGVLREPTLGLRSIDQNETNSSIIKPGDPTLSNVDDDPDDVEATFISDITDEDAQSLIEPSLSHVASRLKSTQTPALEKVAVMEDLDGSGPFDSEPDSPSLEAEWPPETQARPELPTNAKESINNPLQLKGNSGSSRRSPPLKPEASQLPITPWHADTKRILLQPRVATQQSSLHGVFSSSRTRSLSGGAEALRKLLPKALPSIAQVGNLFGSSGDGQRSKRSSSLFSDSVTLQMARSSSPTVPRFPITASQPTTRTHERIITTRPQVLARPGNPGRSSEPSNLRRVTSDDSLLYHSVSRASSLGDDSRFENHHVQVNSRVKAIRDSFQDRSSFRMPQMPSMPSMPRVPSFSFSFLPATASIPWRTDTDVRPEILPTAAYKRNSDILASPVRAAVPRLDTAAKPISPVTNDHSTNSLDRVLNSLTGDVVIMGGYRGSVLRSTKTNRQVWVPVKVGLNIRKVDLEVGLEPEDEERMPETIYPSG